jgi:hypothetical protein
LASVEELLELRRLRRQRQGIDLAKLNAGGGKKKKKTQDEDEDEQYGLRQGGQRKDGLDDE